MAPSTRNRRRYSVVAIPAPPTTTLWPGRMASAVTAAPTRQATEMAVETPALRRSSSASTAPTLVTSTKGRRLIPCRRSGLVERVGVGLATHPNSAWVRECVSAGAIGPGVRRERRHRARQDDQHRGGDQLFDVARRAPQRPADEEGGVDEQEEARPDADDVVPGRDRRHGQRGDGEPGGAREGGSVR